MHYDRKSNWLHRGGASGGLAACRAVGHGHDASNVRGAACGGARTSGGFDRQSAQVAETALRLDDTGRSRIGLKLAPQPQDLHVDAAVEHILVHAGRLQKMLAGKRALRCVEESDKQGILSLRQRDGGTIGVGEAPTAPIELPAAEPATAARRIPWRCKAPGIPLQYGPPPRQQLAEAQPRGCASLLSQPRPHPP